MSRAARILVVDDDAWIQRRAATALGQRGFLISLAGDVQGAIAVASTFHPDVIVTSVSMPEINGRLWWERLRSAAATATIPILFLQPHGDPSTEIRGRSPRDQTLRKPFRVEDLEKAVVKALETAPSEATASQPMSSLPPRPVRAVDPTKPSAGFRPLSIVRGEIDQISLASILTVLEMERKTGLLLVEGPRGIGRLYLHRGRIVRGEIEDSRLTGAPAVYEVLSWGQGGFDFLAGDVGGVDDIQTSTTFLIIEGARRQDEARRGEQAAITGRAAGVEDQKL
jgi:CheY-like chemotaxis protein